MPIRVRLTGLFALVMMVVLVATGVFLHVRVRAELWHAIDTALVSRAEVLSASLRETVPSLGNGSNLIDIDQAFAQILGADGAVLESSPNLVGSLIPPEEATTVTRPLFLDRTVRLRDETIPARILVAPSDAGPVVVVGSSLEEEHETLAALARLLGIGGAVALGLATLVVWLLTGVAFRPVDRMRQEAEAVSISEPGRRLSLPSGGDEIARLGASLNGMLERLQQALDRERRFVDEASHELRTPLTVLKGELELALSRPRTKEELEAALRRAAAESDVLARLTEDLLVLARADGGRLPVRRSRVDVGSAIDQVRDAFRARADEQGVKIETTTDGIGHADFDPVRIRQALSNLVDNSLRHVPPGGRVTVGATRVDGALVLEVSDSGPGFPPEMLERPFEPFGPGGGGLGLAIVRAVVEAHGGSVSLDGAAPDGARVTLCFPGV